MATNPSRTGSLVRVAEWAMEAVPMPASLEKTPRRMPLHHYPNGSSLHGLRVNGVMENRLKCWPDISGMATQNPQPG